MQFHAAIQMRQARKWSYSLWASMFLFGGLHWPLSLPPPLPQPQPLPLPPSLILARLPSKRPRSMLVSNSPILGRPRSDLNRDGNQYEDDDDEE